ncbi:hypothetical protein EII17_10910 [Clostridiales bacterium COT073_COT-073]|nr:hypothetical protein EII17_10910 [Clostridiales bacterium COT073_COT-073]
MKIRIKDVQWEVMGKAKEIMAQIDDYLAKEGLLLNNLIVDKVEIYDYFETYLQENTTESSRIEVVTLTYEELVKHLFNQWNESNQRLLEEAESLSLIFYRNEQLAERWEKLVQILEKGYAMLQDAEDILFLQKKIPEQDSRITAEKIEQLSNILKLFQTGLEEKDEIYLADLLHFELATFLEKLDK